jgi:hypothetical protein
MTLTSLEEIFPTGLRVLALKWSVPIFALEYVNGALPALLVTDLPVLPPLGPESTPNLMSAPCMGRPQLFRSVAVTVAAV